MVAKNEHAAVTRLGFCFELSYCFLFTDSFVNDTVILYATLISDQL